MGRPVVRDGLNLRGGCPHLVVLPVELRVGVCQDKSEWSVELVLRCLGDRVLQYLLGVRRLVVECQDKTSFDEARVLRFPCFRVLQCSDWMICSEGECPGSCEFGEQVELAGPKVHPSRVYHAHQCFCWMIRSAGCSLDRSVRFHCCWSRHHLYHFRWRRR